jgi:DNA-binding XRE family transcriptional regulator
MPMHEARRLLPAGLTVAPGIPGRPDDVLYDLLYDMLRRCDVNGSVDFPSLVRDLRQVRGLTQEQLAREIGVTFSTINGWENGKHQPMPVLATRLLEMAEEAGIRKPDQPSGGSRRTPRRTRGERT